MAPRGQVPSLSPYTYLLGHDATASYYRRRMLLPLRTDVGVCCYRSVLTWVYAATREYYMVVTLGDEELLALLRNLRADLDRGGISLQGFEDAKAKLLRAAADKFRSSPNLRLGFRPPS
eukprot:2030472-Rhodomonas_salina.2